MSVNRILKKRKQQGQLSSQTNIPESGEMPQFAPDQPKMSQQEVRLEQEFEKYAQFAQYNPSSYQFSNTHLPYNAMLNNRFRMPLSIVAPPVAYDMEPVQISVDKIPRCGSCRAYMNYYNEVLKNSFKCFLCGRQNGFYGQYRPDAESIEMTQPSYHVLGGQNVYNQAPPENAFIFLVDVSNASFQSKGLYYFVAAVKEVLSREDLNETQIYFYTYDEVVHEYDFSGEQVKCTILDSSIGNSNGKISENFLQKIRDKLFDLLDTLEEISENNKKQGSNFFQSFSYVYESIKHTGGKMFIFQANEAIIGEQICAQNLKNANNEVEPRPRSLLEPRNKLFFNKFIQLLLNANISFSMFIFEKNFKNIKVFSDTAKLTNSDLLTYRKDSPEDLMKFYYDISYLLGTSYYSDVRMELIPSPGWIFTAVYANLYRIKQYISFKMCHLDPSKRACISIQPQEVNQLPYFSMQVITNYLYNRQHFVTVNTIVLPLTTNLQKLWMNQDYSISSTSIHRAFLSSLRLEEVNILRNKFIKHVGGIWKSACDFYKKKIPQQINNLMLSQLALLKSPHFQLESVLDTIGFDIVVSQRNTLQFSGIGELQNFFSPYLFNLSLMTEQMCLDDENFVYPEVCQLKFSSIKEGIYLLDNGLSLYLYISKTCDPSLLKKLFGKEKLSKNDYLSEQTINSKSTFGQQIINLIRVCREQKSFGWVPLYVVRCGEGTVSEKTFYMNFYAEKYDEFRGCKLNLSEFLATLGQQY